MLKTLKDLFNSLVLPPHAGGSAPLATEHTLQLATAVLLVVEVMHGQRPDRRRRAQRHAGGAARQVRVDCRRERLLELADRTARDATDFFGFTSRLDEAFGMEQKLRMVESVWRVACADGTLSAHENDVMWKVSDLLHIPHGAHVSAQMRARDATGAA